MCAKFSSDRLNRSTSKLSYKVFPRATGETNKSDVIRKCFPSFIKKQTYHNNRWGNAFPSPPRRSFLVLSPSVEAGSESTRKTIIRRVMRWILWGLCMWMGKFLPNLLENSGGGGGNLWNVSHGVSLRGEDALLCWRWRWVQSGYFNELWTWRTRIIVRDLCGITQF